MVTMSQNYSLTQSPQSVPLVLTGDNTLSHLRDHSKDVYANLERGGARLANRINEYWTNANLPLRINRFGSILKLDFDTSSNGTQDAPRHSFEDAADVFFVHLLDCGVTVHASQVMYLSTAHTDSEIDSIVDALISASEQTAADGFF